MTMLCPTLNTTSDQGLVTRLERLVHGRTGSRIRDLSIEVLDDQVILNGRANTYYAKQLATHAALGEVWPRTLINSIDVV